jgi:hypothetical protein
MSEGDPTASSIFPPLPEDALPVVNLRYPLFPALDVPVENDIAPLEPDRPALAVTKVTLPLLVSRPYPAEKKILPPLRVDPSPAKTETPPPCPPCPADTWIFPASCDDDDVCPEEIYTLPPPSSPDPTEKVMLPPLPELAEPLDNNTSPEFPTLAVPVENFTSPLTPVTPAFTVYKKTEPLVDASDMPPYTYTDPPVAEEEPTASPPTRLTSEPLPLTESPTRILTTPAVPPEESPVEKIISPVSPPFEPPVSSVTKPLSPPPAALAVCRVDEPLLVATPYPLDNNIPPPDAPYD